jgi:hypothetical protein
VADPCGVTEALAAERGPFDVAVVANLLPDGTPWDLLGAIRHCDGTEGGALTTYGDEEVHQRVEQAWFAAFLTKPWGLDRLEAATQKAAAKRRQSHGEGGGWPNWEACERAKSWPAGKPGTLGNRALPGSRPRRHAGG